jgi:hypothetical protein
MAASIGLVELLRANVAKELAKELVSQKYESLRKDLEGIRRTREPPAVKESSENTRKLGR